MTEPLTVFQWSLEQSAQGYLLVAYEQAQDSANQVGWWLVDPDSRSPIRQRRIITVVLPTDVEHVNALGEAWRPILAG